MHRIDGAGATVDNKFTQGNPAGGVPATVVTDDWLNDVQENISEAIEQAGIVLAKGNFSQLAQAIGQLSGRVMASKYGYLPTNSAAQNAAAMLTAITDCVTNSRRLWIASGIYQQNPVTIDGALAANWTTLFVEGEASTTAQQSYTDANGLRKGVLINTSGQNAFNVSLDAFAQETIHFENVGFRNSGARGATTAIKITQNSAGFPRGVQLVNIASSGFYAGLSIETTVLGVNGFGTMLIDRYTSYNNSIPLLFTGAVGTTVMVDLLTIRNTLFHGATAGGMVMLGTCPVYATLQDTHFEGCEPAGIVTSASETTLNLVNVSAEATGTSGTGLGFIDTSLTGELRLNVSGVGYGFNFMPQEYRLKRHCTINASSPVKVSGLGWITNTPQLVTPVVSNNATYGQTDLATFCMCPLHTNVGRVGQRVFDRFDGSNTGTGVACPDSVEIPEGLRNHFVGTKSAGQTPTYNISDSFTAPADGFVYSSWAASITPADNGFVAGSDIRINGVNVVTIAHQYGPYMGNFLFLAPIANGQVLARCSLALDANPNWITHAYTTFETSPLNMFEAACGHPRETTTTFYLATANNATVQDYGDGATPFSLNLKLIFGGGKYGYKEYLVTGDGVSNANRVYTLIASSVVAGIAVTPNLGTNAELYSITVANTSGVAVSITKQVRYLS